VHRTPGHTRNTDLTIVCHGGRCSDLSGPAGALRIGHETKKDIPMLMRFAKDNYVASFLFSGGVTTHVVSLKLFRLKS